MTYTIPLFSYVQGYPWLQFCFGPFSIWIILHYGWHLFSIVTQPIRLFLSLYYFAIFCIQIWLYMHLCLLPSVSNNLDPVFLVNILLIHSWMIPYYFFVAVILGFWLREAYTAKVKKKLFMLRYELRHMRGWLPRF